MKYKRRGRPKSRRERRERAATPRPQKDDTQPIPASVASDRRGSQSIERERRAPTELGVRLLFLAFIIFFAGLLGAALLLRYQAAQATWPTREDVGIGLGVGLLGIVLLSASSGFMMAARRVADIRRIGLARILLAGALASGLTFLGIRMYEYRNLYDAGLFPDLENKMVFSQPDVYYLQAVRASLERHFRRLDDRRVNRPDIFSGEDQQKLDFVSRLQVDMVAWTEGEVGHWLDDVEQRRASIEIVAHQIHPLLRKQADVRGHVHTERQRLSRQTQWFAALRDYCEQKTKMYQQSKDSEANDQQASLDQLDQEIRARLERMGITQWAFAQSVVSDTSDLAMAGERLNQTESRLDAIAGREAFLDEMVEPLLDQPPSDGLNATNRWLRLPVSVPQGNRWASGYYTLTSLHAAAVIVLSIALPLTLFTRSRQAFTRRLRRLCPFWHASTAIAVAVLLLVCCL